MVSLRAAVFIACLALVCLHVEAQTSSWSYAKQDKWDGVCSAGFRQSPIDINFVDGTTVYDNNMGPIGFQGFGNVPKGDVVVANNGRTLVAAISPLANLQVAGGPLASPYTIAQLNFHWGKDDFSGSDHTVNGKSYPFEAHFVGYRGATLKESMASPEPDALVELAVLFKIGAPNPTIQSIIDAAKGLSAGKRRMVKRVVDLSALIPRAASTEFSTYIGSLASPPCTENVAWVVFRNKLTVSSEQLQQLRALTDDYGHSLKTTFRAPKPLFGRQVRTSFPFAVRQNVVSVAQTPIGPVTYPVSTVSTPAAGAPSGPALVPIVDAPAPKVNVKQFSMHATPNAGVGSTSTTYNTEPINSNDPNGPQKLSTVVHVDVDKPAPAPVPVAVAAPVDIVAAATANCPTCHVVTAYAESDAELKQMVAEDAQENTAVAAEAASFIETGALPPKEVSIPQSLSQPPTPIRKLAIILEKDIDYGQKKEPSFEEMMEQKETAARIKAEMADMNHIAFDTWRREHKPIVPPNTIEAKYVPEPYSNNQHPEITGVDKLTYAPYPVPANMQRIEHFYPANVEGQFHEVDSYYPEPKPLPNKLGFELPPISKTLHLDAGYQVQGTFTTIPEVNQVYTPPQGPLTKTAGSTMIPATAYPKKNYKPLTQNNNKRDGFEWIDKLPRKDKFFSEPSFLETAATATTSLSALSETMEQAEKQQQVAVNALHNAVEAIQSPVDVAQAQALVKTNIAQLQPRLDALAAFQSNRLTGTEGLVEAEDMREVEVKREEAIRQHIGTVTSSVDALQRAQASVGAPKDSNTNMAAQQLRTMLDAVNQLRAARAVTPNADPAVHALAQELENVSAHRAQEANRLAELQALRERIQMEAKKFSESAYLAPSSSQALQSSMDELLQQAQAPTAQSTTAAVQEALQSVNLLEQAQEGALQAQTKKVEMLSQTKNRHAAAIETAKLEELKRKHAETLKQEHETVVALSQLKEEVKKQEAQIAANKATLEELKQKEAEATEKLEKINAQLAQKKVSSKISSLVEQGARARAAAKKIGVEQTHRVRKAIRDTVVDTGDLPVLVETEAENEFDASVKAQLDLTKARLARRIKALQSAILANELEELAE